MDPQDLDQMLAELREAFRPRIQREVSELEALIGGPNADPKALSTARRVAHKLCGSSGTLGFAGVSTVLADLEAAIDHQLRGGTPSPAALAPLLERLRVECDRATSPESEGLG